MGFQTGLLILWKDEFDLPRGEKGLGEPCPTISGWSTSEFINLGRVTASEKLDPGYSQMKFGPDERARICFAGVIVDKLAERLGSGDTTLFAPVIHYPNILSDKRIASLNQARGSESDLIELGYMNCGCGCEVHEDYRVSMSYLSCDVVEKHNALIRQSKAELSELAKKYNFIIEPPMLWASCTEVVMWLDDCEENEDTNWKYLTADEDAVAQWKAWREHLREVSRRNTRILFRFSHR